MLGYDATDDLIDLEGRAFVAPYHYDRTVPFTDISQPHMPFRETDELDLICKDGSVCTTRVFRRRLIWQGTNAVQLAFIDLTESKRAEKALAISEERYRDLIEGSTLAMQITDRHLKRLFVNNAMVALLGYESAEELRAVEEFGAIAPEYRNQVRAANQFDLESGSTQQPHEIELLQKDGTIVPVQVFRRKILWEGEAAIHRTFVDISERKRAETALVDSEERYRRLFEESPLGIRITDTNGNRMVNQAMATMAGYDSVDEILALPRRTLIAPHHRDRTVTEEKIMAGGKDLPNSVEMDIVKKDGSLLPVQVFWRTLEWRGVKAVERTFIDVSERKEHERALQERDKTVQELRLALANASQIGAMGEVASVIAHELHQPLAAIANTANAAQRRLSDGKEDITVVLNEMLPLISSQASRAGRVIGGIRNLFDGRRVERSREDINLVVAEACELAANEFPSDILEIEQHFADHSPIVQIDRVQIQQVIYNLLRNAVDAMGSSTSKDVIVSIAEIDKLMVEISVRDYGPGLPGHVRPKLFEPFFTTKKQGMGMGMGLYTCQRIVEGHDGRIWAESSDDGGTTIRFTLPLAGSAADGTGSVH
ncbi:MAG: PAS domain S-box protein [Rhodospirillaceae bacterium]|nr:PAS domain S-box protein [Rhodospirillaceae bacterium]